MAQSLEVRELLKKVRRIHIQSKKSVEEFLAGQYQSAFKGEGIEFHEVREYQAGDDVRAIDWNVTARFGKLYVKTFVEEREQSVIFLVDASPSIAFGSRVRLKSERLAELLALLSLAAVANNDRVGLILFSDRLEQHIPLRKGLKHGLHLIRKLLFYKAKGHGTRIDKALDYLNRVQRKRAIVFLISDFLDQGFEKSLGMAANRHDLIALRVVDPREKILKGGGILGIRDLENGHRMEVDLGNQALRERFALSAKERSETLKKTLRTLGVDLLEVDTEESCADLLRLFFQQRVMRRSV